MEKYFGEVTELVFFIEKPTDLKVPIKDNSYKVKDDLKNIFSKFSNFITANVTFSNATITKTIYKCSIRFSGQFKFDLVTLGKILKSLGFPNAFDIDIKGVPILEQLGIRDDEEFT